MSENKKKDNRNYRIFRVEENPDRIFPKKITMIRIHAENNEDAYKQLKEYIKTANKIYRYYVESWTPHIVIRNGKRYEYDDLVDLWYDEHKNEKWYKKTWDSILLTCWKYFVRIPKDIYYWFRDLIYLIRTKQQYHASWCIDDILLDTILFNLPILKANKQTLSWKMLDKAILEKNPSFTKADLNNYYKEHYSGYGKEIEDRSVVLEHEMFDNLVNDIKTYRYYAGEYEYIDKKNKDLVETDKKLRHTLPLIPGSYDRYDYEKLNALVTKYWNRIWETVRMYGLEFND